MSKYQQISAHDGQSQDDSLEYFIKFPTSKSGGGAEQNGTSSEADYVFIHNENTVPIVLLLGWAGCQDKYLMKYSKIYEDRGLITVRYTAPVENLFWKRSSLKVIGEKILKLIYDMNFDAHPLFFHVFSNGGAYMYQHINYAMRRSTRPVQVWGMIFDSAPGERRFSSLYGAISAIYGRERSFNWLVSFLISATLTVMWLIEDVYSVIRSFWNPHEPPLWNPMKNLKNATHSCPQMFLYSKEDTIIPYQDIESFADYRQSKGVFVKKICFEKSEHVKHFIVHPQYYVKCVCRFISDCLASYQASGPSTKID
ncbi:transmembrane protein 53 [Lutzomyia longipalpis]|uniref:transmembrane protein 53 n=1 Tax=Lutzomyia longipalpis TaxID=7200 RepID=UPI0024836472|nr:transmembrane protein 53 [Lutzomyia longipalpis]